jgi:hypothetical protein
MELTEAQQDAEETIRIIMSEEFIGMPECEYAYTQITTLIEENELVPALSLNMPDKERAPTRGAPAIMQKSHFLLQGAKDALPARLLCRGRNKHSRHTGP